MITHGAKSGICLENSSIISAGAKRYHESPLHTCHHSYNCVRYECRQDGVRAKEDPEGTYSFFKIFLMQTILIHTFSRLLAFRLFSQNPSSSYLRQPDWKRQRYIIPNVTVFLAIVVLSDSDENEENEEKKIPKKIRKVSNKRCSRRLLIHRLLTVPYFHVISSRSSAVRYRLPSGMSVKTTNPRRPPPRYIKIIQDGRL